MTPHPDKDYLTQKIDHLFLVMNSLSQQQNVPPEIVHETALLILKELQKNKKVTNLEDQFLLQKILIFLSEWQNQNEKISYVLILEITKIARLLNSRGVNLDEIVALLIDEITQVKPKIVD